MSQKKIERKAHCSQKSSFRHLAHENEKNRYWTFRWVSTSHSAIFFFFWVRCRRCFFANYFIQCNFLKKWWFRLRKYIFFTLYTYTTFSLFPLKYNTNSAETRNYIKFCPEEFRERSLYPTAVCKSAKIAMSQKELSHKTTCSGGPRNFFSKIFEMEINNLY